MQLRWLAGLAALALLVACTEHLPRAFDDTPDDASAPDGAMVVDGSVVDGGLDGDVPVEADAGPDGDAAVPCTDSDASVPAIDFAPIVDNDLTTPVESVLNDGKLYVVEQGGRILRINGENNAPVSVVFDVSRKIVAGGEAGLLGLAFHPQFATNGFVYLYYTIPHPQQPPPKGIVFQSLLVRYHSSDNGLTFDPTSEHPILTVDQPYSNHNGATIAFGNDGLLYWGLGDGGSGGDPNGNAQNTNVLLGKMLRLDVDTNDPYLSPPTNPFAGGTGRGEIFAYGLRNPYRWRFDRPTGDLWVGDVGQGAREEIDKVTLGGNYGWNVREGLICYASTTCGTSGFIDPIVDHNRTEATTIIGGVVYRGTAIATLTGRYVYGDFGLKRYYTIPIDQSAPTPVVIAHRTNDGVLPTSFTLDATGEIVVTSYNGGLYRMIPAKKCP